MLIYLTLNSSTHTPRDHLPLILLPHPAAFDLSSPSYNLETLLSALVFHPIYLLTTIYPSSDSKLCMADHRAPIFHHAPKRPRR